MSRKLSESFAQYSEYEAESSESSQLKSCRLEEHIEQLELEDKPNEIPKRKMFLKEYFVNTCRFVFYMMQK